MNRCLTNNFSQKWLAVFLLLVIVAISVPFRADAHASLLQAVPAADSQWERSPEEVSLRFNERLENRLFEITVVDERSRPVTSNDAIMSDDQTQIQLELPALGEGAYTVSYRVISADGHPVGGSYVFVVGDADPAEAAGLSGGTTGELSWSMGVLEYARYGSRILFFLSFVMIAGWVFWRMFHRKADAAIQQVDGHWSIGLQRAFLISTLLLTSTHLGNYVEFGVWEDMLAFAGTTTGIAWIMLFALSFIGFVLLHRSRFFDSLWLLLLLFTQSFIGHSYGIGGENGAILVNFVHLLAAAVWGGGLLYIAVHWKNRRDHVKQFLPQYSHLALDSIILLVLSGGLMVFLFLPDLSYLLYTQWGIMMLIKIALVLGVIAVGSYLRRAIKKNEETALRKGLKLDFSLMAAILLVVGIMTTLSPLPPNQAFSWHEMGERAHITVKIDPKIPGAKNEFTVITWLPDEQPEPKRVQLYMHYLDDESIERLEIPLTPAEQEEGQNWFPGYIQSVYSYEGSALAMAGRWEIEVRIMDAEDYETVAKQVMHVY